MFRFPSFFFHKPFLNSFHVFLFLSPNQIFVLFLEETSPVCIAFLNGNHLWATRDRQLFTRIWHCYPPHRRWLLIDKFLFFLTELTIVSFFLSLCSPSFSASHWSGNCTTVLFASVKNPSQPSQFYRRQIDIHSKFIATHGIDPSTLPPTLSTASPDSSHDPPPPNPMPAPFHLPLWSPKEDDKAITYTHKEKPSTLFNFQQYSLAAQLLGGEQDGRQYRNKIS